MSVEIDMLKKSCQPASNSKTAGKDKKRAINLEAQAKPKENKWAWKDVLHKPNKTNEEGIPVKQVNDKKYYWFPHHNDEKHKWVIHHPIACENVHSPEEGCPMQTSPPVTPSKEQVHPPRNDSPARAKLITLGSG